MGNDEECKDNIEKLIREYADIRRKFEVCKKKYPKHLSGNDNYVGIIGEYWAIKFVEQINKNGIEEFLKKREEEKISKSQEWYDIELTNEYINVKAISSENKRKQSSPIKIGNDKFKPDDKKPDKICSIIIIKLNEELFPKELLYIKNIDNLINLKCLKYTSKPEQKIYFKYNNGFNKQCGEIYKYEQNSFIKENNEQ